MDPFLLPRVAIDNADPLAKFALRVFTPLEDLRGRKAAQAWPPAPPASVGLVRGNELLVDRFRKLVRRQQAL
jgi:hypothetical protein